MKKRTWHRLMPFSLSIIISVGFFVAGSRLLFADYHRTVTTVTTTTTTMPAVVVGQQDLTRTPQEAAVLVPATQNLKEVRTSIRFDLDVKKFFQFNENVHGTIIVTNTSNVPLADTFTIRLYHNDKLVRELLTRISRIVPGQNRFSFEDFGIPQINSSAAAQGNWTVSVYDTDPSLSKDVDFKIMPSTNSSNLQR